MELYARVRRAVMVEGGVSGRARYSRWSWLRIRITAGRTWNTGSGTVTGHYLWVGTIPAIPGGYDLANIEPFTSTSAAVTLPTNGATICVRLWTQLNSSTWLYNDYTYS